MGRLGDRDEPIRANPLNTIRFVRALHLQLLLGVRPADPTLGRYPAPPAIRVDLLGVLQAALRTTGPFVARAES